MLIAGEWRMCDDGVTRPSVRAKVRDVDGTYQAEVFLVDSCADRTVLGANLLGRLRFPTPAPSSGLGLRGIGGVLGFVQLSTALEFTRDDGVPIHVRGEFAAFTDPDATDLSILGRDVLDLFDVIVSRRRDEVLLLAPNHGYRVDQA